VEATRRYLWSKCHRYTDSGAMPDNFATPSLTVCCLLDSPPAPPLSIYIQPAPLSLSPSNCALHASTAHGHSMQLATAGLPLRLHICLAANCLPPPLSIYIQLSTTSLLLSLYPCPAAHCMPPPLTVIPCIWQLPASLSASIYVRLPACQSLTLCESLVVRAVCGYSSFGGRDVHSEERLGSSPSRRPSSASTLTTLGRTPRRMPGRPGRCNGRTPSRMHPVRQIFRTWHLV